MKLLKISSISTVLMSVDIVFAFISDNATNNSSNSNEKEMIEWIYFQFLD